MIIALITHAKRQPNIAKPIRQCAHTHDKGFIMLNTTREKTTGRYLRRLIGLVAQLPSSTLIMWTPTHPTTPGQAPGPDDFEVRTHTRCTPVKPLNAAGRFDTHSNTHKHTFSRSYADQMHACARYRTLNLSILAVNDDVSVCARIQSQLQCGVHGFMEYVQ